MDHRKFPAELPRIVFDRPSAMTQRRFRSVLSSWRADQYKQPIVNPRKAGRLLPCLRVLPQLQALPKKWCTSVKWNDRMKSCRWMFRLGGRSSGYEWPKHSRGGVRFIPPVIRACVSAVATWVAAAIFPSLGFPSRWQ